MKREKAQLPINRLYSNAEFRQGSLNQVKAIVKDRADLKVIRR